MPDVDAELLQMSITDLNSCMDAELLRACHDISDGGLAVALAEMCIGGDVGAQIDLSTLDPLPNTVSLFSESNTRWVVEVDQGREKEFLEKMKAPVTRIGEVSGNSLSICNDGLVLEKPVDVLRERWSKPLWELL